MAALQRAYAAIDHAHIAAFLFAIVAALTTEVACAQSVLEFDKWMQRIDRRSQSVQRNLALKDASAAVADAREIGELYKLMEGYFLRKGSADSAVTLSREGEELAATVVRSLQGNDFKAASQAAVSIAKACRTCHFDYKPLD
jgi:hypothetical protein